MRSQSGTISVPLLAILMPIVGLTAIMATLLVFTFQALRAHESLEGHPGVLKITSELNSQIDGLSFQAGENRRRLSLLEEKLEKLEMADSAMGQEVKGLETIPPLISRVATIEAEMKTLKESRDERVNDMVHRDR